MTESVKLESDSAIESVKISKKTRKPEEMITVFELDGREYAVPAKPGPGLMLRFMKERRTIGDAEASTNVLTAYLGEEAMDALAESPDVDVDDIAQVFTVLGKIFFKGLERLGDAAGN